MKRRSAHNLQLPLYLCGYLSATIRVWPVRFLAPLLIGADQLLHIDFHTEPFRRSSGANLLF